MNEFVYKLIKILKIIWYTLIRKVLINMKQVSFIDKLWGEVDMLHDHFKKRCDNCKNLIDMLNKVATATKDYSKAMNSIVQKNYKLFLPEEGDLSISKATDEIKANISQQSNEFNVIAEQIKTDCTEDFQTLLNLMVVVGLIPVTGVTLPFISYGGSSLLVSMASIGIILNISRNNNIKRYQLLK